MTEKMTKNKNAPNFIGAILFISTELSQARDMAEED